MLIHVRSNTTARGNWYIHVHRIMTGMFTPIRINHDVENRTTLGNENKTISLRRFHKARDDASECLHRGNIYLQYTAKRGQFVGITWRLGSNYFNTRSHDTGV